MVITPVLHTEGLRFKLGRGHKRLSWFLVRAVTMCLVSKDIEGPLSTHSQGILFLDSRFPEDVLVERIVSKKYQKEFVNSLIPIPRLLISSHIYCQTYFTLLNNTKVLTQRKYLMDNHKKMINKTCTYNVLLSCEYYHTMLKKKQLM